MSITFIEYINTHDTPNIDSFVRVFASNINNIPDEILSSKQLMHYLGLDEVDSFCYENNYKFRVFQNTFLEYFKFKLQTVS